MTIGSFTVDVELLQPTERSKEIKSKNSFSQSENLQKIRVQIKNWVNDYNGNKWFDIMKCRAKMPTTCEMTWNTWEICERRWCQFMTHQVLNIFFFEVSLFVVTSVVVFWLSSLINARALSGSSRHKFESSFTPWSSSYFMRTLKDVFDLSIHFISYLVIFLILFFFLRP